MFLNVSLVHSGRLLTEAATFLLQTGQLLVQQGQAMAATIEPPAMPAPQDATDDDRMPQPPQP